MTRLMLAFMLVTAISAIPLITSQNQPWATFFAFAYIFAVGWLVTDPRRK